MLEMRSSSEDEMGTDDLNIDNLDMEDLPPVGTPMLVDETEYHEDGPQPMDNDVDKESIRRQPSYQNPYIPFLDELEFEFAFRLVKHGISKKAIDNIMSLHTIGSNLPNKHFKSIHTLGKKINKIDPDGIGKHWIMSTINYNARSSETPYYWRDPLKVVKDLLQNPSYQNDLIYTSCKLSGKFGERIYGELHTVD